LEVEMSKQTRRKYSDEFKADAVSLVEQEGYGVTEAARRLGIDRSCLDRWRREQRQQQGAPSSSGGRDERDQELRQLREENRKLKTERDILKKAAFFANESS
jgi:transposase